MTILIIQSYIIISQTAIDNILVEDWGSPDRFAPSHQLGLLPSRQAQPAQ